METPDKTQSIDNEPHAEPVLKRLSRRLSVFSLALLLTILPVLVISPPAHADTTLDQIISDLGVKDTTQINLLGADFGRVSDQLGCEKDFLDLIITRKLTKDVFLSCQGQLSNIVKILAPYVDKQQNIQLPSPWLPFVLGGDPASVIISGIFSTDVGRSLLQLTASAANVTACATYVAVLGEAAVLNAAALAAFTQGTLTGNLYIGFALACGDVAASILTLIAPIAIWFHPTVLGSGDATTPLLGPAPVAPTAKQYCPSAGLSSIACLAPSSPTGTTSGGGTGSGSGGTTTPPPPPTCTPASSQAALFVGKNFMGQCVVLNGGTYNDPSSMNIPNDSVSSVKVGANAKLELCRDSGLSNTCQWFSSDNSDLSTTSIGAAQASSAQVVDLSQYVTLCSSVQLQGNCKSFGPGTVPDLSVYGLSSNVVSIHVSSSVTLFLNDGTNLSGQPGIFNNDVMDLTPNGWNSRAKSLKIENRYDTSCNSRPDQNGILLYRNTNFDPGGGCTLLTADNNDLGASLHFTNGTSLQFVGNYINHYQATIYVDANYGTACGTYSVNQSDLLNCASKTASIRIRPYTPPTPANNLASHASRDQAGSDAVVDNSLSTEWIGGHAKPIGFVFDGPQTIQDVVVFDRAQSPTDNNQINKIQLVFSDGTIINDIDMTSGGPRCAEASFPAKTVSWVNVVPTDSSGNNGYREVQIWDTAGSVSSQNNCVKKYQYTPPPGNGPAPIIQNIVPQVTGGTYTVQQGLVNPVYVQATDPGNGLSLSASNLPPSSTFTDYGNGLGAITFNSNTPTVGSYPVTVQASNGWQTATTTVTINVTPPPPPATVTCNTGWTCEDISNDGIQTLTTTYTPSTATWSVQGSGSDIWGTTDHFHFNFAPLSGDGSVSAQLVSQTNTNAWAKAGPMIRGSDANNAAFYFPQQTPANGISVQYRTASGAMAQSIDGYHPSFGLPYYLKASRIGNQYSAYISQDGASWTLIPNSTVAIDGLGANAAAGLAVTSHDGSQVSTAVYYDGQINATPQPTTPPSTVPCNAGWTCQDINNDGVQDLVSTYTPATGVWSVQGSGSDIWGGTDHFHFNSTALSGDGSLSAQLISQTNTNAWAKAGPMIRSSAANNAAYYFPQQTPANGISVQYRSTDGATAQSIDGYNPPYALPYYLKASRVGNQYSTYISQDGANWTLIPNSTITINSIGSSALAGLAVTSHDSSQVSTAVFANVQLSTSQGLTPSPSPTGAVFEDFQSGIGAWWQGGGPVSSGQEGSNQFLRFTPGAGSASESNHAVYSAALANYNSITVSINLHGTTLLGNDASALYLYQGTGWKFVPLSDYVQQGKDGWQTVSIPLSAFSGFDKSQSFDSLGFRFWVNNTSTIDIDNIIVNL
jgi:hypothetical protein